MIRAVVVAAEVRSLAKRSAEAAKEIKHLIAASVERVAAGTTSSESVGNSMTEIVEHVQGVKDLINKIAATSKEQSREISVLSTELAQIENVTHQNTALVEEVSAAANSLKNLSEELVDTVGFFHLG